MKLKPCRLKFVYIEFVQMIALKTCLFQVAIRMRYIFRMFWTNPLTNFSAWLWRKRSRSNNIFKIAIWRWQMNALNSVGSQIEILNWVLAKWIAGDLSAFLSVLSVSAANGLTVISGRLNEQIKACLWYFLNSFSIHARFAPSRRSYSWMVTMNTNHWIPEYSDLNMIAKTFCV